MGKHTGLNYLIFGILLAGGAVILPTATETCSDSGFGQSCVQTVYTYFGLSAPTAKVLLGIVAVLLIVGGVYVLSRSKGIPLSSKARARVRLAATTVLPPSDALNAVHQAAGSVKGGGASLLTSGLQNIGAQVNVERKSPDRLALSITSGKRLFELCTFSAQVAGPGSDGKTRLRVGGLETYKTNQTRLYMVIPIGPKEIAGYDPYMRFLNAVASVLNERDPSAQVSIETPPTH